LKLIPIEGADDWEAATMRSASAPFEHIGLIQRQRLDQGSRAIT